AVPQRMIPARWSLADRPDPLLVTALATDLRIPEPLAAILVQRGLAAAEVAKAFLRPELERLSDPLAWADMGAAVALVAAAVRGGTRRDRHRPSPPRGRPPPRYGRARSAARRLPLRGQGAVRYRGRLQARPGPDADPGAVAQRAAPLSGLRGARDRGGRRAPRGRKPHSRAPRLEDAGRVALDGAARP